MLDVIFKGGFYRIKQKHLSLAKQIVRNKWGFYPTVVADDGEYCIIKL